MRVMVPDHPLIAHKLTLLRDATTPQPTFRHLVDELVTLLAYEATRSVHTVAVDVTTPVALATGVRLARPLPVVVPILRAGLGMLEGMTRLLPTADVGFLGMQRDEETLQTITYARRLPENVAGRDCFMLDPMLATGGTLIAGTTYLLGRGASTVTVLCLLAAPEGLRLLERAFDDRPEVTIVTASIDERLDVRGYIVPGLGDAGDRLYGVV